MRPNHHISAPSFSVRAVSPKNAALRPLAASFNENVLRITQSFDLLAGLVEWACIWKQFEIDAIRGEGEDRWGQPRTEKVEPQQLSYELQEQLLFADLWKYRVDLPPDYIFYPKNLVGVLGRKLGDAGQRGYESMLIAALVQAWTAFEVLAVDVWEEVMNQRPEWAARAAGAQVTRGPDAADDQDRLRGKAFSIDTLKRYGFDLRDKMGTILRGTKKFDFNSLHGIGAAYLASFPEAAKPLFSDENSDRNQMRWLEAVRNAVLHKGKVDEAFLRRVASHPELGKLKVDEPLPVSSKMVENMVGATVRFSTTVVTFVDDQLATPEASSPS